MEKLGQTAYVRSQISWLRSPWKDCMSVAKKQLAVETSTASCIKPCSQLQRLIQQAAFFMVAIIAVTVCLLCCYESLDIPMVTVVWHPLPRVKISLNCEKNCQL